MATSDFKDLNSVFAGSLVGIAICFRLAYNHTRPIYTSYGSIPIHVLCAGSLFIAVGVTGYGVFLSL